MNLIKCEFLDCLYAKAVIQLISLATIGVCVFVRLLQLKPHKEVLYVRGIVTYFGHNTSLLFYTASLLPLTLP